MPKRGEKKVLLNAILHLPRRHPEPRTTGPPRPRRQPSTTAQTARIRAAPRQRPVGRQHHRLADAQGGMHDLVRGTGRGHGGLSSLSGTWASASPISAPSARAIESDQILAPSIKEQVGLDQHGVSSLASRTGNDRSALRRVEGRQPIAVRRLVPALPPVRLAFGAEQAMIP